MMADERIQAVIIQADGVQQPGARLDRSPRPIAGPRQHRNCFGNDASERPQIHDRFHFPRITERSRRDQDRIRELKAAKLYAQIHQ